MANLTDIAVIDFERFRLGEPVEQKAIAKEIVKSFQDIGFVYLKSHGLSQDTVDSMFAWSKKFFHMPLEDKMLAPHPPSGAHHRGYSGIGQEKIIKTSSTGALGLSSIPDYKESFDIGREDDPLMPNIWLPDETLPGFKETCLEFYWECYAMELNILRALAIGLDLDAEYFVRLHSKADNQLRLARYPSLESSKINNNEVTRIGAHSDYGSITLLFQDDLGGLEVEDPNEPGVFKPVKPIPDTLLVNAGDFLMRWSNDTIRSTKHRVRAPPTHSGILKERYSLPYFCSADFETVVECVPGTYSKEKPPKYGPISVRQYVIERLTKAY